MPTNSNCTPCLPPPRCTGYCPDGVRKCYKITFDIGYTNTGSQCVFAKGWSTGCFPIEASQFVAVFMYFDTFAGLVGDDASIIVRSHFGDCDWDGQKPVDGFCRMLEADVDHESVCSDREHKDQSKYLNVTMSIIDVGHAWNPYPDESAILIQAQVIASAFAIGSNCPGLDAHGDFIDFVPVREGIGDFDLFRGTARISELCDLTRDGSVVLDNVLPDMDWTSDVVSPYPTIHVKFGDGGTATITRSDVPCDPCYCYAVYYSIYHSDLVQWSDAVYSHSALMPAETEEKWNFDTHNYCTAIYYKRISYAVKDCASDPDSVCNGIDPGSPPAKPTLVTECVINPHLCDCSNPVIGLCCCLTYIIQIRVYNGSGYEEFVDIPVTRLEGLCQWAGSVTTIAGLVVGNIVPSDGRWNVQVTYTALGITVTTLISTGLAADACPSTDNFTYEPTGTTGLSYNFELLGVGCNCPTNCVECPTDYALVLKLDSDNYYKTFRLTRDDGTCQWSQNGRNDGTFDVVIQPNTDLSSTGHCYYEIVVTWQRLDSSTVTWTFRANANLQCPHEIPLNRFELFSTSVDYGDPAPDLSLHYLTPVKSCEVDASDCPVDLDVVMSGTTVHDLAVTATRGSSTYVWESPPIGFPYYVRINCNGYRKVAVLQFSNSPAGQYVFEQIQTITRGDCPEIENNGWWPVQNNTGDTHVGTLSVVEA